MKQRCGALVGPGGKILQSAQGLLHARISYPLANRGKKVLFKECPASCCSGSLVVNENKPASATLTAAKNNSG